MRIFMWQVGHAHGHVPAIGTDTASEEEKHWLLSFYWWTAFLAVLFLTLNVLLYLAMASFTLPFTQVNGVNIGMQSRSDAIATLEDAFNTQTLDLSIQDSAYSFTLEELGITIDAEETYESLRSVNGIESVPVFKIATNPLVNALPIYKADRQAVIDELAKIVEPDSLAPVSAKLIVPELPGEEITIEPSKLGYEVSPEQMADQLLANVRSTNVESSMSLSEKVLRPGVHESQLQSVLTAAKEVLEEPVVARNEAGKEVTKVSTTTLRRMLVSGDDGSLAFDEDELRDYLREELALYYFTPPSPKRIDNGKVTATGKTGAQLDVDAAFAVFMDDVTSGEKDITLTTKVMEQATVKNGIYPRTEAGLHALIRDFDIEKRGDYRIIVHQLRGGNLRATHKAEISSIPASTYKAFIAYTAMWSTERGLMTLEDKTRHGTVDECMYEMLHVSTDFCAFAIQDYMGWDRIDEILELNGIENTFLANEDRILDKYTTAQDEYKLYRRLYDGTLLNRKHTNHLLTMLKQQMWRSGIPGGSSPSIVADKVGFYNGWINDVGIVYGKKADYIIVALSDGGSFWEINNLSRRIYNFFEN